MGLILLLFCSWAQAQPPLITRQPNSGAYLVKIAGCADCHTVNANQFMAGGYRLVTPFGAFYTPNITSDDETGIGRWSYIDFRNAIRLGRSPTGKIYYPVFPYRSFTKMTDEDIRKIYGYLKSVPPIQNKVRPHDIRFPFDQRWSLRFWQDFFFSNFTIRRANRIKLGVGPFVPDRTKSKQWNRGAYLVEALAHCTECHTPRNLLGALEPLQWMAGSAFTIPGRIVPNITPDTSTGVGSWSKDDWRRFLRTGIKPNRDMVGDEMANVIQNTSSLTDEDREAIIIYLRSLPAVHHWVDLP